MTQNTEKPLTEEQCIALSNLIAANCRAKRLGVSSYSAEGVVFDAMAKLEGAGYQVTLTKAEPIAIVPKEGAA